jgi:hypothetical protein
MFLFVTALRMNPDGESYSDWLPGPEHAAHEGLRLLHAVNERADWSQFGALLQRAADARGQACMALGNYLLFTSAIGAQVLTATVWRAGRPCALPKTDVIVLLREGRVLGQVAWDDLKRVLPGQLEALPGYPVGHAALDFPEDWQLGQVDLKPWEGPLT